MATEDNFIVAIELGSSKVTGIAGSKQPDGAIRILAFAQEPSTTFIRKGRINNVNKMTQCIINMKEKMEQQMQKSISRVYVGIGGMGMHTVSNTVIRNFESKVEVTQEVVDAMCDENRNLTSSDRDILESVPQEYRLGTQNQTDPVGFLTESLEGHFLNIVANSSIREEIRNCFRTANVAIADLPITFQAMADAMLTDPEKRSGCVFVDMGAETTSVAIYKNNLLRHLAVIPLGGANINRDIQSLQIEDEEAERLKLKYGTALVEEDDEEHAPIKLSDGRVVKYDEFTGLVEARVEEIIMNVDNQIKLSHFDKTQLIGGMIITGGAANMKNTEKAFTRDTHFDKIRFVRNIKLTLNTEDFEDFNKYGDCNAALALIDKGEMNCCGGPLGQEPDPTIVVGPTPEEIAAEEAARQAAEEEERKRRLEELEAAEAARKAAAEEEERKRKEEEEKKKNKKNAVSSMFHKFANFMGNLVSEKEN